MNKRVGRIIKRARKKQNLTQEELAKKLNVSSSMISYWETEKGEPDKDIVPKLTEVLKIKEKKFGEKKNNYEIITRKEPSKFNNVLQSIFSKSISYILVTILLSSCYTLIHNYVSNDMYTETYRNIATTTNEKIIKEADKNLSLIKNSQSIIDEKAPEEKAAMIKILEAYSYKLHNYEPYYGEGGNNYQYMEYMAKEYNIFDYESACYLSAFDSNEIIDSKCDLKKEKRLFSGIVLPMRVLIRMDKKTKGFDVKDNSYKCSLKNYEYLRSQMYILGSSNNYSVVLNAYFPGLKINNINERIIAVVYGIQWPNLNVDQLYLELTKAVMEVGDIHE